MLAGPGVTTTSCPERPTLPVGKIVCVGRNYEEHALEMGAPRPEEPILFLKPSTSLLLGGGSVHLPRWSTEIHHEVEAVVRIGAPARDVEPAEAKLLVDACGVGLDLTARDVQTRAKAAGHPWSVAKGWDGAAPLSPLVPLEDLDSLRNGTVTLKVDGSPRQHGKLASMTWWIDELIAHASTRFSLEAGDLLFTGTPAGVGPVHPGNRLVATLDGMALLQIDIAPA